MEKILRIGILLIADAAFKKYHDGAFTPLYPSQYFLLAVPLSSKPFFLFGAPD